MGRSKIVDEQEVVRWIDEGRTYKWMAEKYLDKYELEVGFTMFSNFRRRRGMDGRIVRDDNLIPWEIRPEHRYSWSAQMLRIEGRRRAGHPISTTEAENVEGFKRNLEREGAVVHYDPDAEHGFYLVPRRKDRDFDLIREPAMKTTKRRSA